PVTLTPPFAERTSANDALSASIEGSSKKAASASRSAELASIVTVWPSLGRGSTRIMLLKGSSCVLSSGCDPAFREAKSTPCEIFERRLGKRCVDGSDVIGEGAGTRRAVRRPIDVARERRLQVWPRTRIERGGVGGVPAVERLLDCLQTLRDRHVAQPHFTQRTVEMEKDVVDKILSNVVSEAADCNEPPQDEPDMQSQELESPVDPVRRAERFVQRRPAGGRHDLAAKLLDEDFAGAPGAPAGENHQAALTCRSLRLRRLAFVQPPGLGIRGRSGKQKGSTRRRGLNGKKAGRL